MPELYPEDQKKVDEFLSLPINQVERKPFSPLKLLTILLGVLAVLTGLSYLIALSVGAV